MDFIVRRTWNLVYVNMESFCQALSAMHRPEFSPKQCLVRCMPPGNLRGVTREFPNKQFCLQDVTHGISGRSKVAAENRFKGHPDVIRYASGQERSWASFSRFV